MKNLNSINLSGVPVSDDVLSWMVKNNQTFNDLIISENKYIGDMSMRILGRHKHYMNLDISSTKVSDKGLKHLGKNICYIVLARNPQITDLGMENLVSNCPGLMAVQIPGTAVTTKGVLLLAKLKKLMSLELGVLPDADDATRDRIRKTFKAKGVNLSGF